MVMKTMRKIQRRDFIRLIAVPGAALFVVGYLNVKDKGPEIVSFSDDDSPEARMNARK